MEYRRLGASGLKVSALSYGAWVTFGAQLDENDAYECVKAAFDHGVNFIDNAEAYGMGVAESILGRVLKRGGWRRSDLVIGSKVFWGGDGPNDRGLSRKHVLEGADASLERLQLGYLDLFFCHRPDAQTPIEETVRAMSHLVDTGRVLYWGTSEWSAEQIREAHAIARREHLVPPTMEQPHYNMFVRDRVEGEHRRLYDDLGLGLTTWSPLASGILSGKYQDGIPDGTRLAHPSYTWLQRELAGDEGRRKQEIVRALRPVADGLECTLAQLAIAWCVKNPRVSTVITGASRVAQIHENMKALDVAARLDADTMARIEEILGNAPAPEADWRSM